VSLRARLLAAFAYVLVLVIVALMVPLALNLSRRVDAEVKSEAQGQAQLLAAGAAGRLDNPDQLEQLVDDAARRLGGRVIVVDRNGRLLVDSAGAGLRSTSYANRPEIARALTGQPSQGTRHSDSLGEDLLFTAVPVVRASRPARAVRVTQSVDAVQSEVRTASSRWWRWAPWCCCSAWAWRGCSPAPSRSPSAALRGRRGGWPAATSTRGRGSRARPSSVRSPQPSTT